MDLKKSTPINIDAFKDGVKINPIVSEVLPNHTLDISNHSENVQMQGTVTNGCNLEDVKKILLQIKSYFDLPQFEQEFGDKSGAVKMAVEEALESYQSKKESKDLREKLNSVKEIAKEVVGGIISSRVVELLSRINI